MLAFQDYAAPIHVPNDDISPPAPTTLTRSSHERNLLDSYIASGAICEKRYKYSFFPHTVSLWNKLQETQSLDIFGLKYS